MKSLTLIRKSSLLTLCVLSLVQTTTALAMNQGTQYVDSVEESKRKVRQISQKQAGDPSLLVTVDTVEETKNTGTLIYRVARFFGWL